MSWDGSRLEKVTGVSSEKLEAPEVCHFLRSLDTGTASLVLLKHLSIVYYGAGQGGLACCDSWGGKESDMTEQLN